MTNVLTCRNILSRRMFCTKVKAKMIQGLCKDGKLVHVCLTVKLKQPSLISYHVGYFSTLLNETRIQYLCSQNSDPPSKTRCHFIA